MFKKKIHRLGDLQLKIMKVLWAQPEANVNDVQKSLGSSLAYVTIATMLRKMEERGLVEHRVEGRTFIYRFKITESEVTQGMVSELLEYFFSGSLPAMVSHLLTNREISKEELIELEKLITERKIKS